jgi:hypothetical protein
MIYLNDFILEVIDYDKKQIILPVYNVYVADILDIVRSDIWAYCKLFE